MGQKRKSGLQRGLSEIVARQTAVTEEKARQSANLISKFAEPKSAPSGGIPHDSIPPDGIPQTGMPAHITPHGNRLRIEDRSQARTSLQLAELVREERGYYP